MSGLGRIAAALGAGTLDEAGALRELEPLLREEDAGALALAGFCRLRRGEIGKALALLDRALAREPRHWVALLNRAEARRAAGPDHLAGAAADYRAAALLQPIPDIQVGLAAALRDAGDAAGEQAALEEALRLDPGMAAAWNNLGLLHEREDRVEEALACFEEAFRHAPPGTGTHSDVAENLERALFEKGRRLEAAAPDDEPPHGAPQRFYEEAIARHPAFPGLRLALGTYWLDHCEIGRAEASFAAMAALSPDDPAALINCGVALNRLGRPREALAAYARAEASEQRRDPGTPPSQPLRWNRALSLLALGRLEEGFADYEAREGATPFRPPGGVPRWDGLPFSGRTLLLHAEQGFGDAIQFIRYAALAKELSPDGTVVAACPAPLARLFARAAGIDRVVVPPAWPERFDRQLPLLSLPRVFGTGLATIPAALPTFRLPPATPRAAGSRPLRVALAWSGNPRYANDRRRSCSLDRIEEAGWPRLPGIEWHSFQTGPAAREAAARPWLRDRAPELADFYETALRLRECDLVVAVDTALAHLAGALALPVWVLLPFAPDWRWLRDRADSPWYPTARLFRQPREGDWRAVLDEAASALAALPRP